MNIYGIYDIYEAKYENLVYTTFLDVSAVKTEFWQGTPGHGSDSAFLGTSISWHCHFADHDSPHPCRQRPKKRVNGQQLLLVLALLLLSA